MTRTSLPRFVLDELAATPLKDRHSSLFKMARQLHHHLPANEMANVLENWMRGCGRHVSRREIEDAIKNSISCAWKPRGDSHGVKQAGSTKWPVKNAERIQSICAEGYGLADLWEASPIRIETNEAKTEAIVDGLFPNDPLLCCGKSQHEFDTKPRSEWRGELALLQFITPNPMSAIEGMTKEGKLSRHALNNTGRRRFIVVEFDGGTIDQQANLILHLGTLAPLCCAVHSGGKSLHAWFFVEGQAEEKILRFFRYSVSLGADPATWTKSQFVRMPDGQRSNGAKQTVYFFSLKPLGVAK